MNEDSAINGGRTASSQVYKILSIIAGASALGLMALSISSYSSHYNFKNTPTMMEKSSKSMSVVVYADLSENQKQDLFDEFKSKYNKSYSSNNEEALRYSNFKDFLDLVDEHNSAEVSSGGTYGTHGITKFADLSVDEFKQMYLGFSLKDNDDDNLNDQYYYYKSNIVKDGINGVSFSPSLSETTITVSNWVGIYTTEIQDQGACGSCWAFSASEQMGSDAIKAGLLSISDGPLSAQELVSCDYFDDGCDGGVTIYAYWYTRRAGGIQLASTYPYTSFYDDTYTCDENAKDYVVTLQDFYYLTTEDEMEAHVLNYGPLSVCLCALSFYTYTGGILTSCCTTVDHCVQAVGMNRDENYWLIRNSWGVDWGEDGYIQLLAGVNLCDITYLPTFTTMTAAASDANSAASPQDEDQVKDKEGLMTSSSTREGTLELKPISDRRSLREYSES